MACEVWFYHLERSTSDQALPELLERSLSRGWRCVVRCADAAALEALDDWLWTYRDDSFLPHGRADEPLAERQPILITTAAETPNRPNAAFLVGGAEPPETEGLDRCVVLFDGRNPEATEQARALWRRFRAGGHPVSYWRQSPERGWTRDA